DFDRPSLQQARPSTILQELARQAARWWIRGHTEELLNLARDLSSGSSSLEMAPSRSIEANREDLLLADRLVSLLPSEHPAQRMIFFVDTFEQVEQFDDTAAFSPFRVKALFTEIGVSTFCIYAARSFAQPKRLSKKLPIRLQQFSAREAEIYLQNEA